MSEINEENKKWLKSQKWTFAKTMANIPHEYIFRGNVDKEKFLEIARFIREKGYVEKFYNKPFTYYDVDGYKYWTMGNPLEQTTILNRTKIGDLNRKDRKTYSKLCEY